MRGEKMMEFLEFYGFKEESRKETERKSCVTPVPEPINPFCNVADDEICV